MGPSTLQNTQVKYKYFEISQVQVHSLFCEKDLSKVQVFSKVLKYKYMLHRYTPVQASC